MGTRGGPTGMQSVRSHLRCQYRCWRSGIRGSAFRLDLPRLRFKKVSFSSNYLRRCRDPSVTGGGCFDMFVVARPFHLLLVFSISKSASDIMQLCERGSVYLSGVTTGLLFLDLGTRFLQWGSLDSATQSKWRMQLQIRRTIDECCNR